MNTSHDPLSRTAPATPGTLRWEGHMADDVAATCGAEAGAVLLATADELWLKGKRGDFRIPRAAVLKVGRGGFYPWFLKGILIRHNLPKLPANLQFLAFSASPGELVTGLRYLGYPTR
jgi:hypothetical protein